MTARVPTPGEMAARALPVPASPARRTAYADGARAERERTLADLRRRIAEADAAAKSRDLDVAMAALAQGVAYRELADELAATGQVSAAYAPAHQDALRCNVRNCDGVTA